MWKFKQLSKSSSPIEQLMQAACSSKDITFVVYDVIHNIIVCASGNNVAEKCALDGCVNEKIKNLCDMPFAVLAYNLSNGTVSVVDFVPEVPVANSVLLCVISELLGNATAVNTHETMCCCDEDYDDDYDEVKDDPYPFECGAPVREHVMPTRDSRGRFISKKQKAVETPAPAILSSNFTPLCLGGTL